MPLQETVSRFPPTGAPSNEVHCTRCGRRWLVWSVYGFTHYCDRATP